MTINTPYKVTRSAFVIFFKNREAYGIFTSIALPDIWTILDLKGIADMSGLFKKSLLLDIFLILNKPSQVQKFIGHYHLY